MRVNNAGAVPIRGKIKFMVIYPSGKKDSFEDEVFINKKSHLNKYYRYPLRLNARKGRYRVDGRFLYSEEEIKSETAGNDYFDVV